MAGMVAKAATEVNIASPLYITGVSTDGKFLLGGAFRMQDQIGFPIDGSFDLCAGNRMAIDWMEALCDCWLNDCLKFDSFLRQAEMLTRANLKSQFQETGAVVLAMFPKMKLTENPVDTVCRYILARKRISRLRIGNCHAR